MSSNAEKGNKQEIDINELLSSILDPTDLPHSNLDHALSYFVSNCIITELETDSINLKNEQREFIKKEVEENLFHFLDDFEFSKKFTEDLVNKIKNQH